jgi:hypothetical protein
VRSKFTGELRKAILQAAAPKVPPDHAECRRDCRRSWQCARPHEPARLTTNDDIQTRIDELMAKAADRFAYARCKKGPTQIAI